MPIIGPCFTIVPTIRWTAWRRRVAMYMAAALENIDRFVVRCHRVDPSMIVLKKQRPDNTCVIKIEIGDIRDQQYRHCFEQHSRAGTTQLFFPPRLRSAPALRLSRGQEANLLIARADAFLDACELGIGDGVQARAALRRRQPISRDTWISKPSNGAWSISRAGSADESAKSARGPPPARPLKAPLSTSTSERPASSHIASAPTRSLEFPARTSWLRW